MFNFLFNPTGRINRKAIWLGYLLPYLAITFGLIYLEEQGLGGEIIGLISLVVVLFYIWPSIAVPVKRFHDRNMTGWWVLIFGLVTFGFFILLIVAMVQGFDLEQMANGVEPTDEEAMAAVMGAFSNPLGLAGLAGMAITYLVQFIILYFLPGKEGENKYGPDPRG